MVSFETQNWTGASPYCTSLFPVTQARQMSPAAKGVALIYRFYNNNTFDSSIASETTVLCVFAVSLPAPSTFGDFDTYHAVIPYAGNNGHILPLGPIPDGNMWSGTQIGTFSLPKAHTYTIQILPVNTQTGQNGRVILSNATCGCGSRSYAYDNGIVRTSQRAYAYNRSESDMATNCMACTKAHLIAIVADLEEALRFAREHGMIHPEVDRRIIAAQKEIVALERYDLSPRSIHRSPKREQMIIRQYLPAIRLLRQELMKNIESVGTLEWLAAEFDELYHRFKNET